MFFTSNNYRVVQYSFAKSYTIYCIVKLVKNLYIWSQYTIFVFFCVIIMAFYTFQENNIQKNNI